MVEEERRYSELEKFKSADNRGSLVSINSNHSVPIV